MKRQAGLPHDPIEHSNPKSYAPTVFIVDFLLEIDIRW